MSNAKEMPVPATTEQARAEESVNSTADYSTDSATLQEGISRFSSGRNTAHRTNASLKLDRKVKTLFNTASTAKNMMDTGADASMISAFINSAMKTGTTKPRLKQATLEGVLDEMGISIRYNRVAQCVEFSGVDRHFPALKEDYYFSALPVKFSDTLCDNYTHAEKGDIESYFDVISLEHSYNPVLEFITAQQWDGRDRLSELFGIMGVTDELSKTLIHKWALQAVALLHNTLKRDYSPDGMLVINCALQGIGKTYIGRVLAMRPRWFRDGAKYRAYDKDTIIESTRYFIAEFGEFGRVLKPSQMDDFKAFVTMGNDEFRTPYGRRSSPHPRITSFYGTCNNPEFLVDDENRRFWVVPVQKIDLDALERFNAAQFWRQVYECWKREEAAGRGGTCYRLTPRERAALDSRNVVYQEALPWQDEVETIIEPARADAFCQEYVWAWTSVSDWIGYWNLNEKRNLSAKDITPALNRLKIEKSESNKRSGLTGKPCGKGKARLLPFRCGEAKPAVTVEMEPL